MPGALLQFCDTAFSLRGSLEFVAFPGEKKNRASATWLAVPAWGEVLQLLLLVVLTHSHW